MIRDYPTIDAVATGKNIKRIMQNRGLTVREVQLFLGLSAPQSIYHWLEGKSIPNVDNLYALSDLFRTTVDEIIRGNRHYKSNNTFGDRILLYYNKYIESCAG